MHLRSALTKGVFDNAYLLLVLVTMAWGANAVVGKLAADYMTPVMLTFLRWLCGLTLIAGIAYPHLRREWPLLLEHRWRVLGLGALGFASFNLSLYWALNYTTAINVSIEQAGMPVLVIAANFVIFRQRVSILQLLGTVLTILGVLVTATHGDLEFLLALDLNRGDAIMLLAVMLYASYALALRARPAMHWMTLLAGMALGAFLTILPVMGWECASRGCEFPSWQGWAIVAFVVVFPTLMAQLFFIRSVELIGPNRAGIFTNLVPIFGATFAVVFLGESVLEYHVIGLILVLGGIALAERFAPPAQ